MRANVVLCIGFLCTMLFVSPLPALGQTRTAISDSCSRCHDVALVLPAGHPKVAATSIAVCASCHALKAGTIGSDPFLTHLHTAHATADVACTTCHQWQAGHRFSVPGFRSKVAALSAEDELSMVMHATDNWAHSHDLANIHAQKDFFCATCHRNDLIPDANATTINAQCISCHGGLEKVALTFKGPSYLNPHASHLGSIPCTSCHFGHQESKAYCLNCHSNFNMPIPGGATAAKATKP